MPVPSSVADLSTTPTGNSPLGSDAIGVSLDDYLRSIQALIKQQDSKGADIASSSSITIPPVGKYFIVTGTTTIATIADSWAGRTVVLKFSGACQLTHSIGLILPRSVNIITAAGDTCLISNESTGVWRVVSYQPSAGYQPYDADIPTVSASQSEMEAGTEAALRSMSPLRVKQAIAALAASFPAGTVIFSASPTAPTGFLKANGALVSRTTYSALFAAIGTTFGAGDGSTTFAIPDLRGEFLRGLDDGRGVDAARVLGSAQADEFKSHTHAIGGSLIAGGPSSERAAVGPHGATGATGGTETRPRNVALLACIKF